MAEMVARDREAFKHFLGAYKHQWDLNQYYRTQYDEDLEYYVGHIPENRYPLIYNMSFNKLMPRVWTVLARFMDQMYQPATHNFASVRARKSRDMGRRERIEGLLNFQLETMNDCDMADYGAYMFHLQWMLNAISWGKGIAKSYWKKEERIAPKRYTVPIPIFQNGMIVDVDIQDIIVEEPQVVYDGPYLEVRPNKTFVPHPHYRNIQKMPFIFDVYKRSVDYLRRMQEQGKFRNVNNLGWNQPSGQMSGGAGNYSEDSAEAFAKSIGLEGVQASNFASERMAPEVDIIECYGKYIFPEDEAPYEVGSGVKIKGKESEAIAHIGNYKVLLSLQKNLYKARPYFAIGAYMHPELFWDIGFIRMGKAIQEQVNVLGNTRFQNAIMMVNQMLQVRQDADIDPAALVPKPGGLVPVEVINEDVAPLITPDMSQSGIFKEQEQFFENVISDMLGLYPYNLGQTPPRQEHVGTIYSLQSMGEARTRLLLMTFDHQGFAPLLRYMMLLNTWHLPLGFETRVLGNQGDDFQLLLPGDIHWDYDFTVRYTSLEPALGKHFRLQNLLNWAQTWAQMPFLQHAQLAKAMLELMDVHEADRFIKTPEQMQMEQQVSMQQQLGVMQHQAQLQDQMAAANDERGLIRDMAKAVLKG